MGDALAPLRAAGSEQAAREWLARGRVRATRQRLILAQLLVGDGTDRHVSAETLRAAAQAEGESVSLATVYNALRRFAAEGLLREIRMHSGRSMFDTRVDDHAHFVWIGSGQIEDVPGRTVSVRQIPPPPAGAQIAGVDVMIRLDGSPPRGS